jgi:Glutamate-cysteine ligase
MNRPEYNDIETPYDPAIFQRLQEHGLPFDSPICVVIHITPGIDDLLAKHISHLFIRDPLVVFNESIDQDDESSNDHFEVCLLGTICANHIRNKLLEFTIDELADCSIQATSSRISNRLAC